LISAKAQITMGAADWPSYLEFLTLGTAVGGLILFSLIGSWVFGREYSDRTVKDLLALPTSRSVIVAAKFILVACWSVALIILTFPIALIIGTALSLPEVPVQVILQGGLTLAITAILTLAVVPPILFFASAGHGYLPPMGVAILVMALAQIVGVIGYGEYFPWAIPGVYSQGEPLGVVSYIIVFLTGVAGIAGTLIWWEYADQTH
jgi:ABC-2 type transport system permease protein